jgi:hypothetical protein
MRASFAVCAFEGEVREGCGRSVRCDCAVIEVGGGVVDGCDYDVAGLGDVLPRLLGYRKGWIGLETYSAATVLNEGCTLLAVSLE